MTDQGLPLDKCVVQLPRNPETLQKVSNRLIELSKLIKGVTWKEEWAEELADELEGLSIVVDGLKRQWSREQFLLAKSKTEDPGD